MIAKELKELVEQAAPKGTKVFFEHPDNPEHGDYSTNAALVLAKKQGKDPKELANDIVSKIEEGKPSFLEAVRVEGPGFINFFLSKEYLVRELEEIAKQKEKYGFGKSQDKKVMIEFTDPNPFKEFHIGHLYSNAVGESVARLFESQGAVVKRANYQGDVGLHVAKAVWGIEQREEELKELEKKDFNERVKFLGESYATGDKAYEEGSGKEEIEELNEKIFKKDKGIKELYEKGRKWSLEYFEEIYKTLGTKFDYYYFESEVGEQGKKLVEKGLKEGVFEESRGAVIFPGEKQGLHDRVFITQRGLPTYEAKELGLAPKKYKDFKYDLSLIVTGNEIIGYFQVLLAALRKLKPELAEKTRHLSHGMVRFPEGKISSRKGSVVTARRLLEEVKARVESIMESAGSEIPDKRRRKAAEIIAVGAVKYSLLKVSLGKDIVFDIEKSLSLEGDSGPYLQYTYARCKSILTKGKGGRLEPELSLSREEESVLRLLYRFSETVQSSTEHFSPNLVASFAIDTARAYNAFYNTHRVLQADTEEQKNFRLHLTRAAAQVLKNSLHLLGIETLERM